MRTEDGHIIHKCLNGEPESFGFLVDKYKESVYAFAYTRLRNFHDAEDVTQEVFIKAYKSLRSLKRWDSFLAWLYSITSNLCKNWVREQSRRPDSEAIKDEALERLEIISLDTYREEVARESIRDELEEALDSLPETYRLVLTLHYLGGLSYKEMARFLGKSPAAVKQQISRARSQMKKEMLAMMSGTYERHRLPTGFTFHIFEAVKRVKIEPMPRMNGLPWGVSLATGIIIALLNFGWHLSLPGFMNPLTNPSPPSETIKTEPGQMTVEILKTPRTLVMSDMQGSPGSSNPRLPDQQNAFVMAPGGEGNTFPEEPAGRLGKGWVRRVAYSPDGKLVAIAGGRGVYLHDAVTLSEVRLLGHELWVVAIAFSPDGKILALGDDNAIHLWDVQEQEEIGALRGYKGNVYSIAFSPDGKTLAMGEYAIDATIHLWDVQSRKRIGGLGPTSPVSSLVFSMNGEILCSCGYDDKVIHIWDVQEREEAGVLEGHTDQVLSIVSSPDRRILASSSADRTIRLWDIQGRKQMGILQEQDNVSAIAFSPDGKTLASGYRGEDGNIRLWDVDGQSQTGLLQGHSGDVRSLAFSPDGENLASVLGSGISTVRFWDVREQREVSELRGYTDMVSSIAFSRDGGTLASAGYGVTLWDVVEQEQTGVLKDISDVRVVAFSPDGRTLAAGDYEGTIHLWDVQEQKHLAELKGHTNWIRALAFSPDGKLLASGGMTSMGGANPDNTIRLWDVKEQKQVGLLLGTVRDVWSVAFSPDGKILASADGMEAVIRIWDVQKMKQIETFSKGGISVAFSPDGRTLAAGDLSGTVCLWDIQNKEPLGSLSGHTEMVWSVAFSPDGKWLASGSVDTTVRIWDVKDRSAVAVLKGHTHQVTSVAFSPGGKWFASGSSDGTVQLWEVNLQVPGMSVEPSGKQLGTWGDVKKTELLQNFPNPFNPETWIPYQLAEDSDVAIGIYNVSGQLVRKLNLGQKPSGTYLGKEKAAYWDGRNDAGEPVASDVYFYVMEAGETSADVRKMVMVR